MCLHAVLHTVIIWLETLQRAPSGTRVRVFSLGCLGSLERMELVDSLPVVWIEILVTRTSKGPCMTERSLSSPWPCSMQVRVGARLSCWGVWSTRPTCCHRPQRLSTHHHSCDSQGAVFEVGEIYWVCEERRAVGRGSCRERCRRPVACSHAATLALLACRTLRRTASGCIGSGCTPTRRWLVPGKSVRHDSGTKERLVERFTGKGLEDLVESGHDDLQLQVRVCLTRVLDIEVGPAKHTVQQQLIQVAGILAAGTYSTCLPPSSQMYGGGRSRGLKLVQTAIANYRVLRNFSKVA